MNWQDDRISRVIKLELEITEAVLRGHRPSHDDQYQEKRGELERLRIELNIKRNGSKNQSN
jgi:hypothetical protein